ncbi:response regulator [Teredinibacter purpureus]|jgi:Response regulators consisting of a CheY-like receiver domain and a winged-helix DNA-binding domain|uniref:response regulator n=1 Tax=Teredinibacter purpureus TaxID=2731756 RepID=UPI0005F79919|nr:response regulator [Teredinibacter purpureus]
MSVSTVLVVDDSPVDLAHLKIIVEGAGYQVVTATNGKDAQDKAKACHPDVILMDVVMDGVDGFEACRNITKDAATAKIPVFFVTSKSQKADKVWGELQGGKGMISKPFTPEQIIDTIAAV